MECALTYGDTPIGHTIGVNLEVREALQVLEGANVPSSLIQKSVAISGIVLEMAGKAQVGNGAEIATKLLESGKALEKMRQIIEIQGGNSTVTSEDIHPGEYSFDVNAPLEGYVVEMNNRSLISLARTAGSPVDAGAGIYIHKKRGQQVEKGEAIFTIYADRPWRLEQAIEHGRQLMPILVEGMLIDRVPSDIWRG